VQATEKADIAIVAPGFDVGRWFGDHSALILALVCWQLFGGDNRQTGSHFTLIRISRTWWLLVRNPPAIGTPYRLGINISRANQKQGKTKGA
jgi:hypothetical protein